METTKELYKNLTPLLNCIDYTVSDESYEVMYNKKYDMLVTSPVPVNLENYYVSEAYISHTDSKKTLFDKAYQLVKNHTLKQKLKLINSFKSEEKTILDIGAGTGDFLKVCKENNWKVSGVEPSEKARSFASKKNIELQEDISNYKGKQFDVISLWHVLEHIPNLIEYTNQLKKLLKPNGVLIIAVPNYKSYDAKKYKEFWAAYDVPRHLWHFSQTAIKKIFATTNMKVVKILPMKFDAFYVSLLSEKYKNNTSKPISAFFTGLTSNIKAKKSGEYSSLIYLIKNN
ncbi:class I SAM-dependent methyltransferase [Tenacibaculum finnmarkense]|uniref:class I SAM-dependent methyltransferase n=1 Tax=Tenacibaculum finnmarkense TaxID=2781243 RepID=UPI001E59AB6D|nr:class I SAM-dependent methyltransferase [Tenacibaculum finnmarkense]MCD8443475.1 class I SAM-dependent methyltransferase [Tenacibaculum finnmarkense genomovar ulcerans]